MRAGRGALGRRRRRLQDARREPDRDRAGRRRRCSRDPPAIFNLAFRFSEPWPDIQDIAGTLTDTAWWREHDQAHALADGDVGQFAATVDFGKLRRGVSDPMHGEPGGIPTTGPMNRILSSRFADGEGVDYNVTCGEPDGCTGQYLGRLQPYAIYVPEKHAAALRPDAAPALARGDVQPVRATRTTSRSSASAARATS